MIMKRTVIFGMALTAAMSVVAQDPYDAERFATQDLNGTARYVGMGGALGALGGDISTMGSNPAGTGLLRKSEFTFSLGGVFGASGVLGHDGGRASVDNAGILISLPVDEGSVRYFNFGVNYVKNKNYFSNINTDVLGLGGQFSQTFQVAGLCNEALADDYWSEGSLVDISAPLRDDDGNLIKDGIVLEERDGKGTLLGFNGVGASDAHYQRATHGSDNQVDMNMSVNVSDQFFFGASVGVHNIDYSRESFYEEMGIDEHYFDFTNWYDTKGDGMDVKLGAIIRPVASSPFRFGISLQTPTWYHLEDANGTVLYLDDQHIQSSVFDPYEYRYQTPWKFGVSLGYTVGSVFAIGAEYQYSDLSTCKYTDFDGYESSYFAYQNSMMKETLKGQSTLKLGMEIKPVSEFSIRLGYNYVSAPFKSDAYRIIMYDSPFGDTDFTNWKDTHRITFGLGYRYKGGYVDLAYQYNAQKGDFYAFDEINLKPTEIDCNRSQLMCTFGFRF